MKFKNIASLSLVFFFLAGTAFAQDTKDTTVRAQRLEFHQVYEPKIETPKKVELQASLPNIVSQTPVYNYVIPQQTLTYHYKSVPIRPLALPRHTYNYTSHFENYAQIGLGNRNGLLFDVGIASAKWRVSKLQLHAKHFSQSSKVDEKLDAMTETNLHFNTILDAHDFNASLGFERLGLRYYGYDKDQYLIDDNYNKQAYNIISASVGLESRDKVAEAFQYYPQFTYKYLFDRWDNLENQFLLDIPMSYEIDEQFDVGVDLGMHLAGLETGVGMHSASNWRNILSAMPYGTYSNDFMSAKAGLKLAHGSHYLETNKVSKFYFLPELSTEFSVLKHKLHLNLGWKADLLQNTFESLAKQNPFLMEIPNVAQTKTDQVFLGAKASIGKHLSLGAQMNWRQWKNLPVFVNNYGFSPDGRTFTMLNLEQLQAYQPEVFAQFNFGKTFGVNANFVYNYFTNLQGLDAAYHLPKTTLGLGINATLIDYLTLEGQLKVLSGITALDAMQNSFTLEPIYDLNFNASYDFTGLGNNFMKRWVAFVGINNMINHKYQRWFQNETFGINFIGGLRFKF